MFDKRIASAVALLWCLTCGVSRPSAADEVTIARGAAFSASSLASKLISATPQLECVLKPGVCDYHVRGTPPSWAGTPIEAIAGVLKNGQPVVSVTLQSEGNGRGHLFEALLWTKLAGHYRFVGYIPQFEGGDIEVSLGDGYLVVTNGVYGPNDPDCCPKQSRIELYTLDGITLRKISQATVPITTYPGSQLHVPTKL